MHVLDAHYAGYTLCTCWDTPSIAYASRTLNEDEKRYGQIDKEALAIMLGLKRFHL